MVMDYLKLTAVEFEKTPKNNNICKQEHMQT